MALATPTAHPATPTATPTGPPTAQPAAHRSPRRGYLLAIAAATLWGVNGVLSKIVLDDGVAASRSRGDA